MALDYQPNESFIVNNFEQLEETEVSHSDDEIWIFQFPISRGSASSQFPEIGGDDIKIDDFDKDGSIGGFVDSSGTKFDLVSYAPQDTESTVILPSEESVIGGSISRRVALVRYPEPTELLQTIKARSQQKLVGAVTSSSGKYSNPSQSSRHKSGQSVRHSASSRSSKQKSLFSSFTDAPKSPKRKHSESASGKHGNSTSTVSGSSERSGKSKKKKKVKMEE
ncbi:hypothetical protein CARUB_v10027088mg [Capsella rubella]|uniref:Mediator-associated protein 2 n=1 Tax=Capsella rubella TaxID=81985 RepID=R0EU50_9BRAS|nr:mediator-associated protein 2 [Capsella rubella]XP_023638778.1 mediator-associated protein 2 [Capsella rubella]EOA12592.1 hypothetical protein CARUB_v10027088mg [Capsella rubella]